MKLPKFSLVVASVIILLLFYVFSFTFKTDHSFDQDLGRHLKLGEIITSTHSIPKINLFSYTYPEFPFINHHYLFEVLVYLGQQAVGLQALLWIKLAILLSSVAIVLSLIKKSSYPLLLPISFIFLHTMRERVELRPEIFSFFCTAFTFYILEKFSQKPSKLIFILPLIQLFWVNTHIYFFVGFILQAIYFIHFYLQKEKESVKTLLLVILLSAGTSLLNPNFIQGFLYPFQVLGNYGYTIAENQNLFLLESLGFRDANFLFVKLSVLLIAVSLIIGYLRKSLQIKYVLLSLAGGILALWHVRSFPYLVFLSLPATLANFGKIPATLLIKTLIKILSLIVVFLLLAESFFYLSGDYYKLTDSDTIPQLSFKENIKEAMNFIKQNNLPNPIFNNFDIGSYLIYQGYPEYRVFVDGRPESYPKEFFQNVYIPVQENPELFKELDQKFGFQTIVFSHTDQTPWAKTFLNHITYNPNWQTVYFDNFMIIFVKSNIAQSHNFPVVDLLNLSSDDYHFSNSIDWERMAIFLLNQEYIASSRVFAKQALKLSPESPIGQSIKATIDGKFNQKFSNNIWW